MRADVVVVGGGPAGCYSGLMLARSGFRVVVLEEHREVGIPTCCAGVVGLKGLKEIGVGYSEHVLSRLRRAIIHSPSGHEVEIGRGRVEAVVLDRAGFDRAISEEAQAAGATLLKGARCVALRFGKSVRAEFSGKSSGTVEADLAIGADGAASSVARMAGLVRRMEYILCAQTEVRGRCDDDVAEIFLGKSHAPGFFGWMVSAGGRCRIGTGSLKGNPLANLRNLIYGNPDLCGRVSIRGKIKVCARPIPASFVRRPFGRRAILVGDAAGQVKSLTGGGILMGLRCAGIAAETAKSWFENPKGTLSGYGKEVDRVFGREIKLGQLARRFFRSMSDDDLDAAVRLLEGKMGKVIRSNFDFDNHGKLIAALMKKLPDIVSEFGFKRALSTAGRSVKVK